MSVNWEGTTHIRHRTYNEICHIVPFSVWHNFRSQTMVHRFAGVPEAAFRERINNPGNPITLGHNLHKNMDHLYWVIEFTRMLFTFGIVNCNCEHYSIVTKTSA